jgi:hypothetical protein
METTNGVNLVEEKSVTDSLIDGLAAGIIAGLGMGLFLILAEWVLGEAPASILNRFVPWENPTPLVGGLLHLAVSSVYGMIFGGLVHVCLRLLRLKLPVWLLGLLYGLLLFLLAQFVILPGMQTN